MKINAKTLIGPICIALLISACEISQAKIVSLHVGSSDPVTEGWNLQSLAGFTAGPVLNDSGLGIDSWNTTDVDVGGSYSYFLSASEIAILNGRRWTLSARLRVNSGIDHISGNTHNSTAMYFQTPGYVFAAEFGKQADGDPVVFLWNDGPTETFTKIVLEGVGDTYHLYEMRYDPAGSTVSLFVDGISKYTGYSGLNLNQGYPTAVLFGNPSTVGLGSANWNSVTFSIPDGGSSAALFCIVSISAACFQRFERNTGMRKCM